MAHGDHSNEPMVRHLRGHLGPEVWVSKSSDVSDAGVGVLRFSAARDLAGKTCIGTSTVGLRQHRLHSSVDGRELRQELFCLGRRSGDERSIERSLLRAALDAVATGHAWLRGEVLADLEVELGELGKAALYWAIPARLPRDFASVPLNDGCRAALCWGIPISRAEA